MKTDTVRWCKGYKRKYIKRPVASIEGLAAVDTLVTSANVVDQRIGVQTAVAGDGQAFSVAERFGLNRHKSAIDLVLPQRRYCLMLQLLYCPARKLVRLRRLQDARTCQSV